MTSSSFHPPQPSCHELFRNTDDGDPTVPTGDIVAHEPPAPADVHAVEARRMRAFAGQRKFQAPVEEDFSRGMLATGQVASDDAKAPRYSRLINSLTTWLRR
ncbi:hypothetical protein DM05_3075 [Pseudomonas poae]|jgi:hypothetical protein|uniref:Type III secretion protein n=2 Tax=Pseudomonas TaxID=286 RepID=A0A7Z1GXF3_9PSED|nr:hypothetical protein FX984_04076 [Pseudomonas marginalis]PFG72676.1 hypothetical protein DM05_3075 [Pseudomonas poae]PUB39009.1 hypothetical protein C8K58_11746 [Pseudomonas sp. GV047]SCX36979.1 hypothetical protein SAMN03159437_05857 [Pseudomonas sp. NFACC25]SMF75793.1 hypothetical protein SAMN05660912_05967 [Pseudomonas sp. LAMO17WK12:I1]